MRFTIVSDSLTSFTGFAKQTRLLASELSRRGHEVIVVSRADQGRADVSWDQQDCACGPVEWPAANFFDVQEVQALVERSEPDIVLFFRNARYLERFARSTLSERAKILFWYADENESPRVSDYSATEIFPDGSLLPVSEAVADCVSPKKIAGILHHGLDFENLPPPSDRATLRQDWASRLGVALPADDILLLCAERNDVRKNWDAVYATVRGVRDLLPGKRVRLIQLTSRTQKEPYFELERCAKLYGIENAVIDISRDGAKFNDAEVYQLLRLSDLRLSCSGSEGFGLLSLEAAALRVPQVSVKLRALAEFLGENNPSLVEPCRLALYPKDDFYYASKCYAIPDVVEISKRVVKILCDEPFRAQVVEDSYQRSRATCHFPNLVDKLLEIIARIPTPTQATR